MTPKRPPDSPTEWLAVAAGIFILAPGTGTVAVGAISVWLWPDNTIIHTTAASTSTAAVAAMLAVLAGVLYVHRRETRPHYQNQ